MNTQRRFLLALCGLSMSMNTSGQEPFSVLMGFEYTEGSYGANLDTEVWITPFSLKYSQGNWSYKVSTSWLRVTSPMNVTPDGDLVNGSGPRFKRFTEEGIGDTTLSATYAMLDQDDYLMGLDVSGRIKLPTADEDKFLGTGQLDYGLNLEFYKDWREWSPYVNIGYRWRGDPKDFNYKNTWLSTLGSDYRLSPQLSVGFAYDWQQRTTQFAQHAQEFSINADYSWNTLNKLNAYLLTGYSNSSPHSGAGLTLTHYF